jgi:hypothetical protein
VHFVEVGQIQAIPENILGAQKWLLVFADAAFLRDLSSLLDIEKGVEAINPPVRREDTQFCGYRCVHFKHRGIEE